MKKKLQNLDYHYHIDEVNRCVVCYLQIAYSSLDSYLNQLIPDKGSAFISTMGFAEELSDHPIKAVAKAWTGDPWDPEGLKKLARMKTERTLYRRIDKWIDRTLQDLYSIAKQAIDNKADVRAKYENRNNKITGHEYYENWRKNEP